MELFVYGSLRRGESADLSKREGATFVETDSINGTLHSLSWYPGVDLSGDGIVLGDVFRIDDPSVLEWLDMYEGHPTLFRRTEVETLSGRKVSVYEYPHKDELTDDNVVPSGDWTLRKESV